MTNLQKRQHLYQIKEAAQKLAHRAEVMINQLENPNPSAERPARIARNAHAQLFANACTETVQAVLELSPSNVKTIVEQLPVTIGIADKLEQNACTSLAAN